MRQNINLNLVMQVLLIFYSIIQLIFLFVISLTKLVMQQDFTLYEDDGFEIKVNVLNPEMKGSANKFTVYTIRGEDKNGNFQCIRRYSDFDNARNVMLNRWPGCFIPSLPQKKMVGNMDAIFIEERRIGLEQFMINLSKIKHIWYSEENQTLIKGPAQIQKILSNYSKVTPYEIIAKYESTFKNLSGKEINGEIVGKINNFNQFLKRISGSLKVFMEMAFNMTNARKVYNQQFTALFQFLLPEYEKRCLTEYLESNTPQQNFIFLNSKDTNFQDLKKKYKDTQLKIQFDSVYMTLKKQTRQVQAFIDVFKVKQNFESLKQKAKEKVKDLQLDKQKAQAGKTSISSMIKSKSKQQTIKQLDQEIQKAQKQQGQYILICDISTVLLGYIEIEKFKKLREFNYYDAIKRITRFEYETAKTENQIWSIVCEKQILSGFEI